MNEPRQREIYCPKCEYRPQLKDRWSCVPSCGTSWHTFWTGGVCPGCGHAWEHTQCPACGKVSPHRDWYHVRDPELAEEKESERDLA